jgi:ribosome maturation factor RimP
MDTALQPVVEPICASFGLSLYDLDRSSQIVRVTVERDGGVDLDTIAALTRAISDRFDELDLGNGRYTLEVSSPGVERRLRTEAQFAGAVGETVTIKMAPGYPVRRIDGVIAQVAGNEVTVRTEDGDLVVPIAAIDRARTVFEWGAKPQPSPSKAKQSRGTKQAREEEGTK